MSDLDLFMSRIGEINAKDATDLTTADIDDVIKYHRAMRAKHAAGEKVMKPNSNITSIVQKLTGKPTQTFRRI